MKAEDLEKLQACLEDLTRISSEISLLYYGGKILPTYEDQGSMVVDLLDVSNKALRNLYTNIKDE